MELEIINLYSNESIRDTGLIGDHGQSFLFKTKENQILLDVGAKGDILLHNMRILGIEPNDIDKMILSHGHYDHTGGLPEFLDARTEPIEIIAHPSLFEKKRIKMLLFTKYIGVPDLTDEQRTKMNITLSKVPKEIIPGLFTTGEIGDRGEKDGSEPTAQHFVDGEWKIDPVWDDISVILATKEGHVVVTGCSHAGILNILNHTKKQYDQPIKAVIGGTHMVRYSHSEVEDTGNLFLNKYDNPELYLNHCTDKLPTKLIRQTPSTKILKDLLGEKVRECKVGTSLIYNI